MFVGISTVTFAMTFTTTQSGGNSFKDLTVQAGKQYQLKFDLQHQTTNNVGIQILEGGTTMIDASNLIDGSHLYSFTPTSYTVTLKFIREDNDNLTRDFQVDNLVYEEISSSVQMESNHIVGNKEYELADHLGDVRVVVSDKKVNASIEVVNATDYLPFGMVARSYSNGTESRYAYNGMEKNSEWNEGSYDFGARIYDGRLGRWLAIDPMVFKYPMFSSYCAMGDNPILFVDVEGRSFVVYIVVEKKNETTSVIEKINYKVTFNGTKTTMQQVTTTKEGTTYGAAIDYTAGTSQFVDDMVSSYKYIVDNGADIDKAMQQLAESTTIELEVKDQKYGCEYAPESNKIFYDFTQGLKVESKLEGEEKAQKGNQSPALGFWSEVYHAYIDKIDLAKKKEFDDANDADQAMEEEYVHGDKEGKVIDLLKLKNPENKERKRVKYTDGYNTMKAKSATSTEEKPKK